MQDTYQAKQFQVNPKFMVKFTVYLQKFNKRIEVKNNITFFVVLPKSRRTRTPVLGRRQTFVRSGPRRTKDEKHPPDSGTDSKLRNLIPTRPEFEFHEILHQQIDDLVLENRKRETRY